MSDSTNSLSEFFYNIVPGGLFIFFFDRYVDVSRYISPPHLIKDESPVFQGFLFLLFSLFFGFVFQGLTKFFRKYVCKLDEKVFLKVKEDNEPEFKQVVSDLKFIRPLTDCPTGKELKEIFYLMDDYLRGKGFARTLQHFTARLAFWSNIFFGTLFLFFIEVFQKNPFDMVFLFLVLVLIFSGWLFWEYLRILYDSVIKTFVTIVKLDKEKGSLLGSRT